MDRIAGEDNAFEVVHHGPSGCSPFVPGAQNRAGHRVTTMYPTGSRCPARNLEKVLHYYKEPHPYYNHDVAVIGAKNSAAIAALELFWTGARVTLIHRGPSISDSVKYWIKPNIENRIKSGEIRAYFNSRVLEILPDSLRIATPEGEISLRNDFVFALIGYRPDLAFLNSTGIMHRPRYT